VLPCLSQGAVLVVGLLAAQAYARFAGGSAELAGAVLAALRRANRETRLGIAGGLAPVPPYEGGELLFLYRATVDGLRAARGENATRQGALAVLVAIVEKVPRGAIDPLQLFLALRRSFDTLPFDFRYLRPLEVTVGIGVDIDYFVTGSKLSVEGLFGLIGTAEAVVIGMLKKVAGAEDVASGLLRVFNQRELAHFAGITIKTAKQPWSLQVLDLLAGIAMAVVGSDDRTVASFRKTIVAVLLPIAENKSHRGRDIAVGTIRAIVQ
jgi:hypothetical protein